MRMIDADELKQEIKNRNPKNINYTMEKAFAIAYLDNAPTVDAQPVRYGHWIEHNDDFGLTHECSVCHAEGMIHGNFCPNCGADMREEDIPMEYFESGGV